MQEQSSAAPAVVLVVEDEPVLRSSMVRGLAKMAGVEVVDASSLAEASRLIEAIRPQLIISDLDLPDGAGVDVIGALDRWGLRSPVLFISAYVASYMPLIPSRSTIEVYEKPVSLLTLRHLVRRRLERNQRQDAPFLPTDYIQLACMGGHSVRLIFDSDGDERGQLVIVEGELYAASDTEGEGEAALRRLLFTSNLSTQCLRLSGPPEPKNIHGSWQGILLEAARLHDEGLPISPLTVDAPMGLPGEAEEVNWASSASAPAPRPEVRVQNVSLGGPPGVNGEPSFDELVAEEIDLSEAIRKATGSLNGQSKNGHLKMSNGAGSPSGPASGSIEVEIPERLAGETAPEPAVKTANGGFAAELAYVELDEVDVDHEVTMIGMGQQIQSSEPEQAAPPEQATSEDEGAEEVEEQEPDPRSFGEVYGDAVEALLAKDYQVAQKLLARAHQLAPEHPSVIANLRRLEALGYRDGQPARRR